MKWLGILLMAVLLAVNPGYGLAQPQGKTPSPPAAPNGPQVTPAPVTPTTKSFTPEERKAYEKKAAKDLAAIRTKIGDLKGEYIKAKPQIKRALRRQIAVLDRQAIAAQNLLASLPKAAEKDWAGLKAEMDKKMDSLKKAYEGTAAQIK